MAKPSSLMKLLWLVGAVSTLAGVACSGDAAAGDMSTAPGEEAAANGAMAAELTPSAGAADLEPSGKGPWPQCSKTLPGGTGGEPEKTLPVCCTPNSEERPLVEELFKAMNAYRASHQKPALVIDEALQAAVQAHCLHMAVHEFFAHASPEAAVGSHTGRAKLCGGSASSEIIAAGQSTPAAAISSWSNSAGHNKIMLSNATRVGLCAVQTGGRLWAGLFR